MRRDIKLIGTFSKWEKGGIYAGRIRGFDEWVDRVIFKASGKYLYQFSIDGQTNQGSGG